MLTPNRGSDYVRVHNNGQDAYTAFTPVTSGSFYTSFLVSVDSSQANGGDYFIGLLPSTSTTNYTARFYAKDTTAGMVFGITKGSVALNLLFIPQLLICIIQLIWLSLNTHSIRVQQLMMQ